MIHKQFKSQDIHKSAIATYSRINANTILCYDLQHKTLKNFNVLFNKAAATSVTLSFQFFRCSLMYYFFMFFTVSSHSITNQY